MNRAKLKNNLEIDSDESNHSSHNQNGLIAAEKTNKDIGRGVWGGAAGVWGWNQWSEFEGNIFATMNFTYFFLVQIDSKIAIQRMWSNIRVQGVSKYLSKPHKFHLTQARLLSKLLQLGKPFSLCFQWIYSK